MCPSRVLTQGPQESAKENKSKQPKGSITGMRLCYAHTGLPSLQQVRRRCAGHFSLGRLSTCPNSYFRSPGTNRNLAGQGEGGRSSTRRYCLVAALKGKSNPHFEWQIRMRGRTSFDVCINDQYITAAMIIYCKCIKMYQHTTLQSAS